MIYNIYPVLHFLYNIGWVNQIRSHHQFDPMGMKKVICRRTSTSFVKETNELVN
jgi:DNA-directed RNA polymerase subunit N (RpoN/RPB10)